MPAAASAANIGRPVPTKLEIQVYEKFKEGDHKHMEKKKKLYPELVKPAPPVGAAGTGSVNWIGLNPDPCKAKHQAKMQGPSKAVAAAAKMSKSLSGSTRALDGMSSHQHYLEQRLKLPGVLQENGDPLRRTCVFNGRTEELIYHGVSHEQRG